MQNYGCVARIGIALVCCLGMVSGCAGPLRWHPGDPAASASPESRQQAMRYFIQAKVFEAQKNYYGAIVALRNAADLDPTSATIYAQLATDYNEIRDYQMAEVFSRKALSLDPQRTQLRYLRFRLFERRSAHREAARELEALLPNEPDNWSLYSILARLYLETDQAQRIEPLFEQLLDRSDTPPEIRVDIASIFARNGQQEKARAIYEGLLKEHPDFEDAWMGLAEMQMAQGKRQESIQCYRQAARVTPESSIALYELARLMNVPADLSEILAQEDPRFLYRLGLALADLEKHNLAIHVFEHIIAMQPKTAEGWLDLARYYFQQGNYDQVDQLLSQAVAAMPDSIDLYLFWGVAMERAKRFERAIAIYQQGLERHPGKIDFYLYWGMVMEQQKQWEEAIQVYRRGLAIDPPDPDLEVRWGMALAQQEKWQEAISHYQQAVGADSLHRDAFLYWGIALQKLKQWEPAIEKLRYAAQLDTGSTYALFYLGSCLEQAFQACPEADYFEDAAETFKRLLELDPDDSYALNYLGYMYADRGVHLDEAVELLLRAVSLDPENGAFLDSLGWAYFRLGALDQAEHYLALALGKLNPQEVEGEFVIFDHAGDIAHALGKHEDARNNWKRALELAPGNETLQRKLERLP